MKNADMPAMAGEAEISNKGEAWAFQVGTNSKFRFPGLTKREMFAMNAPKVPQWFIAKCINECDDCDALELGLSGLIDTLNQKGIEKYYFEWRKYYAEKLLEALEK